LNYFAAHDTNPITEFCTNNIPDDGNCEYYNGLIAKFNSDVNT